MPREVKFEGTAASGRSRAVDISLSFPVLLIRVDFKYSIYDEDVNSSKDRNIIAVGFIIIRCLAFSFRHCKLMYI